MTFDDVAALALPLPGTTLGTSYGTPAVKVGGKLLARLREDGDLVLKCDEELRAALVELHPDVFHLTPHYEPYDWILVRLAAAGPEQVAGLVERGWEALATKALRRQRG